jgi:hypothetical protein
LGGVYKTIEINPRYAGKKIHIKAIQKSFVKICEKKFVKTKWDEKKINPLTLAKSEDCHYIKPIL